MSYYFMGQIMMTGFGFAPKGFAQCNGQLMALSQYNALFALLGTTYGGDGRTTFALPNLQSATPTGGVQSVDGSWQPPRYVPGQIAGVEKVTLLTSQMPAHSHAVNVTSVPGNATPSPRAPGLTLAACAPDTSLQYGPGAILPLGGDPLSPAGGSAAHPNIQPYQAINFTIALQGVFPSRN